MMAKMGRPKVEEPRDKRVNVRFTTEEFARLKKYADEHDQSVAQSIRAMVEKETAKKSS